MNEYFPPIEHFTMLSSLPTSEKEAHLRVKSAMLQNLGSRLYKIHSNTSFKGKSERHDEAVIIASQLDVLIKEILCLQQHK
jgi:hypothetical protein